MNRSTSLASLIVAATAALTLTACNRAPEGGAPADSGATSTTPSSMGGSPSTTTSPSTGSLPSDSTSPSTSTPSGVMPPADAASAVPGGGVGGATGGSTGTTGGTTN